MRLWSWRCAVLKAQTLTCARWLPVLVNKLSTASVCLTDSWTDLYLTSGLIVVSQQLKVSYRMLSMMDFRPQNSSSIQLVGVKVLSILLSRLPPLGICIEDWWRPWKNSWLSMMVQWEGLENKLYNSLMERMALILCLWTIKSSQSLLADSIRSLERVLKEIKKRSVWLANKLFS